MSFNRLSTGFHSLTTSKPWESSPDKKRLGALRLTFIRKKHKHRDMCIFAGGPPSYLINRRVSYYIGQVSFQVGRRIAHAFSRKLPPAEGALILGS